jgi:hypothetical protein
MKKGVIILSAVLKRRMIFADKAKSLFISKFVHLFGLCPKLIAPIIEQYLS